MGNISEYGPDGSTRVEQTGSNQWTDPYTGQTHDIPSFSRYTELSENNQAIKNQTDAAQLNLAGLANDQSGMLRERMNTPFEFNNQDAENWAYDLASPRILAQQGQNEERLRTTLANKGIREGSAAWNSEMTRQTQGNSDQMNQLALSGRQMAYNEARDQHTLPLNMITGLMSGAQVSQPQFMGAQMPSIPTTDVAGLINTNYNQRLGQWQQQQQSMGGLLSGLGSLGGSLIGLSDDDAKKDKKRLGDVDGEMGLWEFRYKNEPKSQPKHVGLMASEVEKEKPSAVKRGKDGLRRVDYSKALGLRGMK